MVAAEGLVGVVQEGKVVRLLQVGLLAITLGQLEEAGGYRGGGEDTWGWQEDNDLL